MTTQTEIRDSFWRHHSQYAHERRSNKKQNDYRTDIRVAFVDFVDYLRRDNQISEALAFRATL
jgi:hypothetical protein